MVHAARRLPVALKERAINKLHEMEANGYIVKVTEPTEWVSSMVVSIQGDKVRICIDPSDLNSHQAWALSYENHRRSRQRNTWRQGILQAGCEKRIPPNQAWRSLFTAHNFQYSTRQM